MPIPPIIPMPIPIIPMPPIPIMPYDILLLLLLPRWCPGPR